MGEINCDTCGEQPYIAPLTGDYEEYHDFDEVPDAELWCECGTNRAIAFTNNDHRTDSRPDYWGQSGGRFVCYECGELPRMKTVTSAGGRHHSIQYRLSCRCEKHSWGVEFGWRAIMPDKWKQDMDRTKWPEIEDDIKEVLEENGPMTRLAVAEHFDISEAGVQCVMIHMERDDEIYPDEDFRFMTGRMFVEHETETAPHQQDDDPDETGIRSGKGTGFFSRLLGRNS